MRFDVISYRSCLAGLAGLLLAAPAAAADFTDPVFTEFAGGVAPGFSANGKPAGAALGPDGNVWFAETKAPGRIAKITPAGTVTEFTGGVTPNLGLGHSLTSVARGPDGNLWFGDNTNDGGVVKITPGGAVSEYPRALASGSFTAGITAGPDGNVWFTESASPGRITKVTPTGVMTTVASGGTTPGFTNGGQPRGITLGPDGNLWFTELASPGRIGRITPAGVVTEFTGGVTPGLSFDGQPGGITAGPDGNLWFTEYSGRIGRITPAGVVTEFAVPGREPDMITTGPDGAMWFTQPVSPGAIGRITTAGVLTQFVAGVTPGFTLDRVPTGITTGADGNLWVSEQLDPGGILRISPGPDATPTPTPTPTATPTPSETATPTATETATPGPGPQPTPMEPAPALAPRITGLSSGAPMVVGSPALLSAQVLGSAQHVDWDLNGDGKTEVSCPGNQSTLRFRPPTRAGVARAAAFTGAVSVRAVGAGGAGPALSQTFEVAPAIPAKANPIKDAVTHIIADRPTPYVCGLARDFAASQVELHGGASGANRPCFGRTLMAGTLRIGGCLATVDSINDIPAAERGIVQILARAVGLRSTKPSTVIKNAELVVGQVDGYLATGAVTVNGVDLTAGPKASIVVYTQVNQILSSDAAMTVGGIALENKTGFSLDTRPTRNGEIPLGGFTRLPGGIAGLGGFALPAGRKLDVTLIPGTEASPAGARISTDLTLPSFLDLLGGDTNAHVTLNVTPDGALELEDMHIELPEVKIGLMEVKSLKLDFFHEGRDEVWKGQGIVCILAACVNAAEDPARTPLGGITIRNGEFERAFVNVEFPGDGIPLYPNVFLTSVGAGAGLNPTHFLGSVGVTAYKLYHLDGRVAIAFPSVATPFQLAESEFAGLTEQDYKRRFSTFTIAAAGEATLALDALDMSVKLGSAYFVYSYPGYVHVGGEVNESFAGLMSLTGRTSGEFNLKNGRFNFGQDLEACILDWICRTATTRLSSVGIGACYSIGVGDATITMGGGIRFDPLEILPLPVGCRWSRYEDPGVFDGKLAAAQARAAQASGSFSVTIKKGDRSRSIRLDGAAGAPRVRVTAPDGQVLDSPQGADTALTPALRILRSEQIKATVVGLFEPKPGTYKLDLLPGSPAIAKVTESEDPPPARITARVTGKGSKRTLDYDVLRRPDQKVTFVEVAAAGKRPIGTVTGGRGTLTFSPAPGTDTRHVEAQFELLGVGAETKTVATFRPPSARLGRPSHLSVRRRASRLQVAWTGVAESERYEIVTTLASGGQRITRTRRTAATISRVARDSGGTVTVRAVAPMRQGQAATARFRASGPPPPTRFGPLPRLKGAKASTTLHR